MHDKPQHFKLQNYNFGTCNNLNNTFLNTIKMNQIS